MKTTIQLLIGVIAGIAIGYFFFHNCSAPKPCPDIPVTSVRVDTGHVNVKESTDWYKPEISFLEGGRIPSFNPVFYKPTFAKKDTASKAAFSNDFDFSKIYSDSDVQSQTTFNFYKDRVKTKYGFITIEDSLRNNQIAARRVTTDFDIPAVIRTVVLNAKPKPKLYWAVTAIGDKNYLSAAGGGLMLQFKNKRAIQVNAMYRFQKLFPAQSNTQFQLTLINPFSKH